MNAESTHRSTVGRFILVGLVLPTVAVAVSLIVQFSVMSSLPDPVAIHWGAAGAPDGFGPAWISPVLTVVVGLGLPVLLAAVSLPSLRRGGHGHTYRFLAACALGTALLIAVLSGWTLAMQAGLADAADAPNALLPVIVSFAVGLGGGLAGWYLQPSDPWLRAPGTTADESSGAAMQLEANERAAWMQRTALAPAGIIVLTVAVLVLVGLTIVLALTAPADALPAVWITGTVTVAMVAVIASSTVFHVQVDAAGLRVTSALGWPRFHIPLEDIATVRSVGVNPMGEFGGWGLRWAGGRFGVVLRAGEGIEVTRRNGKVFVVTVDDAETGVALLGALAARV